MAKKHARRRSTPRAHQAGASVPSAKLGAFDAAYQAGDYAQALTLAEALVRNYPYSAQAHERYVNVLGQLRCFREAGEAMARVVHLSETPNVEQHLKLAQYQVMAGQAKASVPNLEAVLNEQPDHFLALVWLSRAYHQLGNNEKAIEASDFAYALDPQHEEMLQWRAIILDRLLRHDDAVETLQQLLAVDPQRRGANNQIAGLYVKEGDYQKAEAHYTKEMELGEDATNGPVYSNLLIAAHYNPDYSAEDITSKVLEWNRRFAIRSPLGRAITPKEPKKRLRIGLLSGGFRIHPVGQMILPALCHLSTEQVELVAYSTSQVVDPLTEQIQQAVQRWEVVDGLDDSQLEKKIRDDSIDILIDMNGGGEGSRYSALASEPAPLIVKWVGGLINTTGLVCFDYLLSDNIETPEGVDDFYTEKLVRLPDDYICYHFPEYAPSAGVLPALRNGYITFGCLNTPAKLSPPLLAEWAILLTEVPGSMLLLRGMQFESARYRDKIAGILAEHGIEADRLIMEKGAPHQEFLSTYQRIDIALDTWPYSGGLTTCEALMMGVPVVTRVGPTFAGRHSATHLINAGLSELVTDSWEAFRQRAKELANDLPNLAVIRAALRTILMDSPICNGPRFAKHLTTALRAIWQRHCEGKAPEALTFSKSGVAQFADEDSPIKLALALPSDGFDWQIDSPVIAVDNGAVLSSRPDARELLGSGRVVMVSFDPGGKLETADHLAQYGEIQHLPQTSLGDGRPTNLYSVDNAEPTTLLPLNGVFNGQQQIPTVSLDSIEGLPNIDFLALDANHDSLKILEYATQALANTLLIQARVAFLPICQRQPSLAELQHWGSRHGFRFYRFHDIHLKSHLPETLKVRSDYGAEQESGDVLLLPSNERMNALSGHQKMKLAFLLSQAFNAHDMAFKLISSAEPKRAVEFLEIHGFLPPSALLENGPVARTNAELKRLVENAQFSSGKANHNLPGNLVVSLTSYHARFSNLHLTLRSLLLQSVRPNVLVLWIAEKERADLPKNVWELVQYGLNISFCEDIRSFKKIIPTLRVYPDSFVVTADDDLYYESDWLRGLIESWDGDNKTIVAHRAHKIRLDKNDQPLPYRSWKWEVGVEEPIDGLIFPTTGAGALYPPNIFHSDVTNVARFTELCPTADDVWLYWMASLNGAKVKRSNYKLNLIEWPDQGGSPLWKVNIQGSGNDAAISNIIGYYDVSGWWKELRKEVSFICHGQSVRFYLPNEDDHIQKLIRTTKSFYEREMLEDVLCRVGDIEAVFDIGANIGNHTTYFAKFLNVGKVFAFEPHSETFSILSRNIRINSLSHKVACFNVGLSDSPGKAVISYYDEKNVGMSQLSRVGSGEIDLMCADDVAMAEGVRVGLMKIDVEGMEISVLNGSRRILFEDLPVLYVEAGTQEEFIRLKSYLSDFGYAPVKRFNATPTYLFLPNG